MLEFNEYLEKLKKQRAMCPNTIIHQEIFKSGTEKRIEGALRGAYASGKLGHERKMQLVNKIKEYCTQKRSKGEILTKFNIIERSLWNYINILKQKNEIIVTRKHKNKYYEVKK